MSELLLPMLALKLSRVEKKLEKKLTAPPKIAPFHNKRLKSTGAKVLSARLPLARFFGNAPIFDGLSDKPTDFCLLYLIFCRCVSYQAAWEENPALKNWLTRSKRVDGKAFCTVCQKDLEFQNGGVYGLERHGRSVAHQNRVRTTKSQPRLRSTASQASTVSQAVTDAELSTAYFIAEHRLPFTTSDHLAQLLSKVCPDSTIAKKIKSGRTKTSASIEVVATTYHQ